MARSHSPSRILHGRNPATFQRPYMLRGIVAIPASCMTISTKGHAGFEVRARCPPAVAPTAYQPENELFTLRV